MSCLSRLPMERGRRLTKDYTAIELAHVPLPDELMDASHADTDPTEAGLRAVSEPPPFAASETMAALLSGRRTEASSSASTRRYCSVPAGCTGPAVLAAVHRRVPILLWLPEYSWGLLRADLLAGLTVGVVLIPQGVAYAMLAELPPIYGLYSSLLPLPIYACMCTSRHMSIGPFALVSLLVADSVSEVVAPDAEGYTEAVMLLSLMIGILHCLMAALNLGVIVRFISDSVSSAALLRSHRPARAGRAIWPSPWPWPWRWAWPRRWPWPPLRLAATPTMPLRGAAARPTPVARPAPVDVCAPRLRPLARVHIAARAHPQSPHRCARPSARWCARPRVGACRCSPASPRRQRCSSPLRS